MKYLLTFCSNDKVDKVENPELLPAHERYDSDIINWVKEESERTDTPALILSGKFGAIDINKPIPHYEHLLTEDELPVMIAEVSNQFEEIQADEIEAYIKKPRSTPGWEAYYELLEQAARNAGVVLNYEPWEPDDEAHSEMSNLR